ncbi:DUF1028 domain-containing protein [Amnibacterium sp. CER49]|uniref:DUF1028 domain-containing protein n=1 Tax=Amnibacterium sp. CER49 TaxID=3039161 RepID=UPI00244702BC|nr:DUF1028 domain-containing protein [Amnibacterium sp. CER49]MDH2444789.1 DUF1028 domain-containing protein [Amnibacterium sp. CER49]
MTYSIVARDPRTGALGVAVQSHYFAVGSAVPAALPGVGAIATQSMANLQYKPQALALLREGRSADEVVAALVAGDPDAAARQVAVVDAAGRAAAHTGDLCISAAGHRLGDGYAVQANLMERDTVWDAMAEAYEAAASEGLGVALLAALDAAEAEGGDLRGRQSAAILVVPAEGTEADRILDLRVEDSPEPLRELRRLVTLNDAYSLGNDVEPLLERGELDAAASVLLAAHAAAPDNPEIAFFVGLDLLRAGRPDRGLALLREVAERDARWLELLRRLPAETSPSAAEALARLEHDAT